MPSVDGEWTLAYSGGLPPAETWASNPQFAIQPTVDGATYAIELVRHDVSGQARCGLWVMKADGVVRSLRRVISVLKPPSVDRQSAVFVEHERRLLNSR